MSDVDIVLGEVPNTEETGDTLTEYVKAVDGHLKFACSDMNYSDEEEAAFKRGYKMGVEAARSELLKFSRRHGSCGLC